MKNKITLIALFLVVIGMTWACSSDSDDPVNSSAPTVTTANVSNITLNSATCGGSVTVTGGATVSARGICWSTSQTPTLEDNTTIVDGTTGTFSSTMTDLEPNTEYFVRAYAVHIGGVVYGGEVSFTTTTSTTPVDLPTLTTSAVTSITETSASGGGNVTADGGEAITARGICWSTTQNPDVEDTKTTSTGTLGAFTGAMTGLTANTQYYVRAYATNSAGTAYGNEVTFTTLTSTGPVTGPEGGNAICDGTKPTVVSTVTSSTGKIWMDRNLGASRAAISSKDFHAYGCFYQWGRGNDGHASIIYTMGEDDDWGNSAATPVNGATTTKSTTDNPGNALFITDQVTLNYDWRNPKNDNLWQGVNGINNPCPAGFRIPTIAELEAEIDAYSITGPNSAFNSVLKIPATGDRAFDSGAVRDQGKYTFLWSSTTDFSKSYDAYIGPDGVYTNAANGRAGGYSVRCIKN